MRLTLLDQRSKGRSALTSWPDVPAYYRATGFAIRAGLRGIRLVNVLNITSRLRAHAAPLTPFDEGGNRPTPGGHPRRCNGAGLAVPALGEKR